MRSAITQMCFLWFLWYSLKKKEKKHTIYSHFTRVNAITSASHQVHFKSEALLCLAPIVTWAWDPHYIPYL